MTTDTNVQNLIINILTKEQYESIANPSSTELYLTPDDDNTSRNIGEIVASTIPLTDAGLHLLDGALIDGNGIYADFVDYISNLDLTANYFCTEAEWQQSVTDYGVCGKFVYDSTNNTVRLPKITGILEGTTDVNALGNLVEAGLPNITGTVTGGYNGQSYIDTENSGAFTNVATASSAKYGGSSYNFRINTFDASNANPIYGNSDTVQPQTIKCYYYIVIATSTKTDIQVDIDEIATDLNGKVDKADLQEVQCVVETYSDGTSWYRVYSDGWCEQGGMSTMPSTSVDVYFLKPFINTNYTVLGASAGNTNVLNVQTAKYVDHITMDYAGTATGNFYWCACGYIEV